MGVLEKNDAKVGVFNASSQESLHIPQSSEDERSEVSLNDVSVHPSRSRHQVPRPMYFISPRKRLGKKKLRHQENVVHLMTLLEEDELEEVTIYDFVPNTQTVFSVILNDESAFQVWHSFINSSDEVQQEVLRPNDSRPSLQCKVPQPGDRPLTGEEAFKNIKTGIRHKLKKARVPQGMLDYLENNLVEFFTQDPTKTYVSESISSFQRLLLHAISQYHRLISQSMEANIENTKQVHVHNPHREVFLLPNVLLGQYLEAKRNQKCTAPLSTRN